MIKAVEKAKAKINLFLEVLGKRDDGYHEIESVMAPVGIFDEVEVSLTDGEITLDTDASLCERPSDFEELDEKNNLAYRAAEEFFASLDEKNVPHGGVEIRIRKKIPVRSGLAGGSADAAAVLRAMNDLFDGVLEESELLFTAEKLGSDVPFCVLSRLAVCRGRGDDITVIESPVKLHGVLTVECDEKLSTGSAYSKVDYYNENEKTEVKCSDDMVRALELCDTAAVKNELYNVFEKACGYSASGAEIMKDAGADNVTLSGAGPAVFTLTDDASLCEKIAEALRAGGYPAYIF